MDIYLNDFHLHSTTEWLPTSVQRPIQGLEGGDPRTVVYDNPGQAGQTVSNILGGSSLITLNGSIRTSSGGNDQERLNEYESNRAAFLNAIRLQYDSSGRPLPLMLHIVMPSGADYLIETYIHSFKSDYDYPTYSTWNLNLINPSGVVSSATSSSVTILLPVVGGIVYPVVYPVVYGNSSGGKAIASNYGNTSAKPVITFYGPLNNPVLTNDAVGKYLRLNLNIQTGYRVEVNTAIPSIVQGTTTGPLTDSRMSARAVGSTFFSIQPGANQIRFTASEYDSGYVTITWQDARERL